jgi:hypothetical protein
MIKMKWFYLLLFVSLTVTNVEAQKQKRSVPQQQVQEPAKIWSVEKAKAWYAQHPW